MRLGYLITKPRRLEKLVMEPIPQALSLAPVSAKTRGSFSFARPWPPKVVSRQHTNVAHGVDVVEADLHPSLGHLLEDFVEVVQRNSSRPCVSILEPFFPFVFPRVAVLEAARTLARAERAAATACLACCSARDASCAKAEAS